MKITQLFQMNPSGPVTKGDLLTVNTRYHGDDIKCQIPVNRTMGQLDRMIFVDIEPGEHGLSEGVGVIFGRAGAATRRPLGYEYGSKINPVQVPIKEPEQQSWDSSILDIETLVHL